MLQMANNCLLQFTPCKRSFQSSFAAKARALSNASRPSPCVSSGLRMCLQRCSGRERWSGWTCSATGTNGCSRDSIRWVCLKKMRKITCDLGGLGVFLFPGSGTNTGYPGFEPFWKLFLARSLAHKSNKMTSEWLIAQGRDSPGGAASLPVELVFKPRGARSSARLPPRPPPFPWVSSRAGRDPSLHQPAHHVTHW